MLVNNLRWIMMNNLQGEGGRGGISTTSSRFILYKPKLSACSYEIVGLKKTSLAYFKCTSALCNMTSFPEGNGS